MTKLETSLLTIRQKLIMKIDSLDLYLILIVTKQQCMKQQSAYPSTYGGRNKTRTNMIYSCLNIVKMT